MTAIGNNGDRSQYSYWLLSFIEDGKRL